MILVLFAQGKLEVILWGGNLTMITLITVYKIHTFVSLVLQTKTNILLTNANGICRIIYALEKLNRSKEIGSYIRTFQRINLLVDC